MANNDVGVRLERNHLMRDEQYWINRYGEDVTIFFNIENTVARDKYNSIKTHSTPSVTKVFKAYPITFNPTQQQIEKAGIKEVCDCLVVIAKKDWDDVSLDLVSDFNVIKAVVDIRGERFNVKEKSLTGHIADQYTTVTIGLSRK